MSLANHPFRAADMGRLCLASLACVRLRVVGLGAFSGCGLVGLGASGRDWLGGGQRSHELPARADAELGEHLAEVPLHGLRTQE